MLIARLAMPNAAVGRVDGNCANLPASSSNTSSSRHFQINPHAAASLALREPPASTGHGPARNRLTRAGSMFHRCPEQAELSECSNKQRGMRRNHDVAGEGNTCGSTRRHAVHCRQGRKFEFLDRLYQRIEITIEARPWIEEVAPFSWFPRELQGPVPTKMHVPSP